MAESLKIESCAGKVCYGDYLGWPENERWEIIDGVPFDMSPAPMIDHQRILRNLQTIVHNFLENKPCELFIAPCDVLLPKYDEPDEQVKTVVQPDLMVVCDKKKITEKNCRGAPDWIVEILSPSTAGRDQIVKRRLYEKAGVKEFWTISPYDRVVFVCLLKDGAYYHAGIYDDTGKIPVSTLPGLTVDMKKVFPKQPPEKHSPSPNSYFREEPADYDASSPKRKRKNS